MKKTTCIATVAIMVASIASAEDSLWSGAYAGLSLGAMQGTATATEYDGAWDYGEYSMTESGTTLGILAGYNWLVGEAGVVGAEADINWSSFNPERTWDTAPIYQNEAQWNWFSTLRARGGIAIDNAMIFVAAGVAIVDAEYTFGDKGTPADRASSSEVTVGYTAGAGVEFAVTDSISVRGEYLYIGLPSEELSDFGGETGDFVSSANIARLACIYNF